MSAGHIRLVPRGYHVNLARLVATASGRAPADLILSNTQVVNTYTRKVEKAHVAIAEGMIAGIGNYTDAAQVLDLKERYLTPSLIDGHIHIESTMLHPVEYVRAVAPRGVLGAVTDLHEIANVAGVDGIRLMMKWCQALPFDFFFMLPSCVPASPFETSGAVVSVEDIKRMRRWKGTTGLGEAMNFPGVVMGDGGMLSKVDLFQDGLIDGHAPHLTGQQLNAYIAAGPRSDHECTSLREAEEKLARGMYIMVREGSSEKNLDALLPLAEGPGHSRLLFVVDDRSCVDLLEDGDVDAVVRRAIAKGLDPLRAIQMATINTAECFRLYRFGAIAPGRVANLIATSDLRTMKPDLVIYRGRQIARDGELTDQLPRLRTGGMDDTVLIKPLSKEQLVLRTGKDTYPVIEVIPGQIITQKTTLPVRKKDGAVVSDTVRDILKLAVIERHHATGNVGLGLVKGFGLKRGALASTVAHDSHNLVVVGCSDDDMLVAAKEMEKMHGGLAVIDGGRVIAAMALPVAGLLSDKPLAAAASEFRHVAQAAREIGAALPAPFATLSFLALPVIPELKLTDKGLVDVSQFRLLTPEELS
ncbi:MAG: adenine deaminase [Chloroflexi bacterium]|nr:adenine deaminase [Chloroflexota bacterium]